MNLSYAMQILFVNIILNFIVLFRFTPLIKAPYPGYLLKFTVINNTRENKPRVHRQVHAKQSHQSLRRVKPSTSDVGELLALLKFTF